MQVQDNIILRTDSYKVSQWKQYPPGTENVYSYFESRGGEFEELCFFGLQYLLKRHFEGEVVSKEKIIKAKRRCDRHFGSDRIFNEAGWLNLLERHGGRLPVRIRAVPEGTCMTPHNVMLTIENTDPRFAWLTNYLETLLVQLWYPTIVASYSRAFMKMLRRHREKSGSLHGIEFGLHDFGFRGVSSVESAGIGGLANLILFRGTDTLESLEIAEDFYGEDDAGYSCPASEHSTMTSWGRDGETAAYANMLDQYPTGLVACVSDSWDIFNAISNVWGGTLRDRVLRRDGRLVIRPDSGSPVPTVRKATDLAFKAFGGGGNDKDYRVLRDQVRLIQGDGVDLVTADAILTGIEEDGYSSDNVGFGSGGALLQKLHRDMGKIAMKCSQIVVNGIPRDVYKQPVGQPDKASKRGRFKLVRENNKFTTVPEDHAGRDVLQDVFVDGKIVSTTTLAEVRARAAL